MTTVKGDNNSIPIIAADIVYEGAMVGDNGAGYGRPLAAGDVFVGHSVDKVDNAAGAAGAKNIQLLAGRYRQIVALVGLITDVGQPVYASDDAVLTFVAPSNSYVGVISRYVSATKMEVEFRPGECDEFGPNTARETKSANYTIDAEDYGKIIYIDTDAFAITLPAIATSGWVTFVNAGGFGTIAINLSPAAADKVMGPDIAGTDNKDLINTKATAQRGDFVTLKYGTADGWMVTAIRGTWATEA
jgi:hypothetical protein